MSTLGSNNRETLAEAQRLIASGLDRPKAITQFRIRWGFSQADAERLYLRANTQNSNANYAPVQRLSTNQTRYGPPTELYGGTRTTGYDRRKLIIVSSVLGAIAIVVIFAVVIASIDFSPPDDSELVWTHQDVVRVDNRRLQFVGTITNTNDSWAVTEPVVVVSFYTESGLLVSTRRNGLEINDIGPGQTRRYFFNLVVFEQFDTYSEDLEWEWIRN